MARMGSFSGGGQLFGRPLSIVHPADNNTSAGRYSEALMDATLRLTEIQRSDLQNEIDDLFAALRGERELF